MKDIIILAGPNGAGKTTARSRRKTNPIRYLEPG